MHCLHHWCVYRLMITVHWWRNSARIIFWRATSKHTLRVLCITTTAVVSVQTLTSVCSSIKSHEILFNRPICKNNLTIVMWILGFSSRRPKVDSCWQLCRVRKGLRYIQCSSAVSVSPRWTCLSCLSRTLGVVDHPSFSLAMVLTLKLQHNGPSYSKTVIGTMWRYNCLWSLNS